MNKPRLSVIIPCYNQGIFLSDALSGVSDQKDIEVIIVNDGSTDPETIEIFKNLDRSKYRVIEQENKGLGTARNIAVENASAEYILALDSDNMVLPDYYRKAIQILDECPEVGVVYANPIFFGVKNENVCLEEFNLCKILYENYIDACAIYRKTAWAQAGGYDGTMPVQGYEDWDLWISIAKNGWKFHYLNEFLFKYRVSESSMITNSNRPDNKRNLLNYIREKHRDLYEKYKFDIMAYLNNNVTVLSNHLEVQKIYFAETEKAYKENNNILQKESMAFQEEIKALHKEVESLNAKAESMRIKNRIKKILGM